MVQISIIVAMDHNRVIGKDDRLPWSISSDLQYFKTITMGKPIVMGRKTYESIGRPLPGRKNIILTRNTEYQVEGCTVLNSFDAMIEYCKAVDEIMVMGGVEIYQFALDKASKIYLTEVHTQIDGNVFFPQLDMNVWQEISRKAYSAGEKDDYDYSFIVLNRK